MKKIVFLPLDERPVTYDYPRMLANIANDINFVEASKEIMGDIKVAGNIQKISEFLLKECKDADYAIIAIDTLLYGGIVPSRLHYESIETLEKRLEVLKKIKEINKNIKIYAYHLIMRCPSGSCADEEPDYYGLCGLEIHNLGKYEHILKERELTNQENEFYQSILKTIKDNDYQKYVDDYVARRKINTALNIKTLDYVKNNVIDFLIIPQDDSAPYGYTALDQIKVRKEIENNNLNLKVLMYPDADAVGNALLARVINNINNITPLVYVRYDTCNNGFIIPCYEDRPVSESIKYQILASGGKEIYDQKEANINLMINLPLNNMLEARHLYDAINYGKKAGETALQYSVGRNLVEFVEYIKYLLSKNECVAIADIAYANGGDINLFNLLKNEKLLYKVSAYAGWNTAANTIGTTLPLAMIQNIYHNQKEFYDFLANRYLEDVGYQSNVRFKAYDIFKNKYKWGKIDGKSDGEVATFIKENLEKWCLENLNDEKKTKLIKHSQPWNRFFECEVVCQVSDK